MGYTPPYLDVRKVASDWTVYPSGSSTGDTLTIKSNPTDANPRIYMAGNGAITVLFPNGQGLAFYDATGSDYLKINWVTPDVQLSTYTNYNLSLLPQGTGRVKFGSYVAGAKTDSTGYIEILDSGGTSRRLMVQSV